MGAVKLRGAGLESDFKGEIKQLQENARDSREVIGILRGLIQEHAAPAGIRRSGAQSMIVKLAEQFFSAQNSHASAVKAVHAIKKDVIERRVRATVKEHEFATGAESGEGSAVNAKLLSMLQQSIEINAAKFIPGSNSEPIDAEFSAVEDVDALIESRLLIEAPEAVRPPEPEKSEDPPREVFADEDGGLWAMGEGGIADPLPGKAQIFSDADGAAYGIHPDGRRLEVVDMTP